MLFKTYCVSSSLNVELNNCNVRCVVVMWLVCATREKVINLTLDCVGYARGA